MMTRDTLKRHLYHFGQFPDQYRTLIWRYLLKCPENVDLFQALIAKGTHPLAETLVKQKLTIEDDKEEASMIQSLSLVTFTHGFVLFTEIDTALCPSL
jgi:hypothetical protein